MSVRLDPALPPLVVDTLASLFGQVNAQSHAFTGQLVNAFSLAERWMIACPLEGWGDADRNALVGLLHTHLRSDSAAKGCLSDAASRRPQSEKDTSGKALESLEWCITENGIWLDMPTRRRPQVAEEWAAVAAKASQMGGGGGAQGGARCFRCAAHIRSPRSTVHPPWRNRTAHRLGACLGDGLELGGAPCNRFPYHGRLFQRPYGLRFVPVSDEFDAHRGNGKPLQQNRRRRKPWLACTIPRDLFLVPFRVFHVQPSMDVGMDQLPCGPAKHPLSVKVVCLT